MNQQRELVNALQTIPWLQKIPEEHFQRILGIASLVEVEAKQELFREGDLEDYLYIVVKGRVALEISVPGRGRTRIYTAEPLDEIGWSSVTPIIRRKTAGARAVLQSYLIRLDSVKLRQLCEEYSDLGYVVMQRMSNVIASRLLTTRLQLLDIFASPGVEEGANG